MNNAPTSSSNSGPASRPADDPRAVFARAAAIGGSVIDATPIDRFGDPTPLDMNVRELLEHLVMVIRRVACAGRGDELATWPIDAADVTDDGFAEAWRSGVDDVEVAWADNTLLDRPTDLPWGTFSGRETLDIYTNEVTVHTWDLAQATGQHPAWDEGVLAVADHAIRSQLPDADRAPMWAAFKETLPPEVEWEDPFGAAVDVPADAPLIDRLVAWNGRQP
jgi:uncharacterized protein (TIGR03086 family)